MTSLTKKRLLVLIGLISLATQVLATDNWVPVNFRVINTTPYDQTVSTDDSSFESGIRIGKTDLVDKSCIWACTQYSPEAPEGELKKGILLGVENVKNAPTKNTLNIGRVNYAWHNKGNQYYTRLKFTILSTKPGKWQRTCNVNISATSAGYTYGNSHANVTLVPDVQGINEGVCEVELTSEPYTIFLDCGRMWCEHRLDPAYPDHHRAKFTVNIKILPDRKYYQEETVACKADDVEVGYYWDEKRVLKTNAPYSPVCAHKKLTVCPIGNRSYKNFLLTFKNPSYGKNEDLNYTIKTSVGLVGWPSTDEIKAANKMNACYKDTGKIRYVRSENSATQQYINQCDVIIPGSKQTANSINTGLQKDSCIEITNNGTDAMWVEAKPEFNR